VLTSFEKTLNDDRSKEKLKPFERSELALLKARAYEDMGEP
jgi:hypothetical protein